MTDVEPTSAEGRRGRGRGSEATARSEALQRLKAIRTGGRRSEINGGYEIKLENPIYDTVAEDEYDLLVAKRKEEARGFIVDDDGLGYGDEGEEEDWSTAGLPPSSDDESDGDGRSLDRVKKKKKKKVEKRERDPNLRKGNAAALSAAAAAIMGKQRISAMFTSSVFKNRRENDKVVKGLECESIVDDVIAKFAPDDVDRESRRRGQVGFVVHPKIPVSNGDFVVKEEKDLDLDLDLDCGVVERRVELELVDDSVGVEMKVEPVVVVKKEGVCTLNAKIMEEEKDPALSATAGWKAAMNGGNGDGGGGVVEVVKNGSIGDGKSDFELDGDGLLHFYIVDAYEEFYGANIGNVYLFGKVM